MQFIDGLYSVSWSRISESCAAFCTCYIMLCRFSRSLDLNATKPKSCSSVRSYNIYLLLSDFTSPFCVWLSDEEENHNCPTYAAAHSWLSSEDAADAHLDRWGRTINKERRIAQGVKDFRLCLCYNALRSRERSADPHQPVRRFLETKQHRDDWLAC